MRISDWSSDVCSSDLRDAARLRDELEGDLDQRPDAPVCHAESVSTTMRHLLAFLCLPLAACSIATSSDEPVVQPAAAAVPVPASEGSVYSTGGGLALFEDRNVRRAGTLLLGLLVVNIVKASESEGV